MWLDVVSGNGYPSSFVLPEWRELPIWLVSRPFLGLHFTTGTSHVSGAASSCLQLLPTWAQVSSPPPCFGLPLHPSSQFRCSKPTWAGSSTILLFPEDQQWELSQCCPSIRQGEWWIMTEPRWRCWASAGPRVPGAQWGVRKLPFKQSPHCFP